MSPEFQVHMLNDLGKIKAHAIANAFDLLLTSLSSICGEKGPGFSIVKTKLEEACFFSKKSMANQKENQDGSPLA